MLVNTHGLIIENGYKVGEYVHGNRLETSLSKMRIKKS